MRIVGMLASAALLVSCGGGSSRPATQNVREGQVATWVRNYGGDGGSATRGNGAYSVADLVALEDGSVLVTGTVVWPGRDATEPVGDSDLWVARIDPESP